MTADDVQSALASAADSEKACFLSRYFKTGAGQYGEGDVFIGVTVPKQRQIAKNYRHLALEEIARLLQSPIHEHRLTALLIMGLQHRRAPESSRSAIYVTLIEHFKGINNWDLVDSSASIVGHHASIKDLLRMSHSSNLWERRMSMVATQDRARRREPEWTFTLAEALIADRADLIQKAVGWMLREVEVYNGLPVLEDWLEGRYRQLGRTALRYALEHFPADRRAYYMAK